MNAILERNEPSTTKTSFADATPLQQLRHRVRLAVHKMLSEDVKGESILASATIVLYNWARDLPATRGFTPRKRVGPNGGDHGQATLLQLLRSSDIKIMLDSAMRQDSADESLKAAALEDLRQWQTAACRELMMARFNELSPGTPGLQDLLMLISLATPHGRSNAHEHGVEAKAYFHALVSRLRMIAGETTSVPHGFGTRNHQQNLRLPSWAEVPANASWLLGSIRKFSEKELDRYLAFHDCGKAFCLTVDSEGRKHYPNHAEVSAQVWAKAGGSALECDLMRKDMLVHTASAGDCPGLATDPLTPVLLLAGLSEIHANALPIFNGFESDSFKAKFKQIERRGNALFKIWMA